MRSLARGALHWCSEVALGLYRSLILVALTVLVPVVVVPVGYFGWRLASSWTAHWAGPVVLLVIAAIGKTLVVIMWIALAAWMLHLLTTRVVVHAARQVAHRWLALEFTVAYKPPAPVVRMATGYWWDGREYHKSEREAQRRAGMNARFHDPQLHWDGLWRLVAAVTVLPVAAVPLIAVAEGAYLLHTHLFRYAVSAIVAGLALAPFAWRILGPSATRFLGPVPSSSLSRRVTELETLRADQTQSQVAELERIERGLHDGAQARLVAMGMAMQAAERLTDTDPDRAKAILADARATSKAALTELRALVRGINPPVLTERGLVDAVRALALDAPLAVAVHSTVPARPERPVESAAYFAVAELLANAAKHARASAVTIDLDYRERTLTVTVTDNGIGGAAASAGSGLSGIERRMKAFDGRVEIDSPAGGPTRVTVAAPCALL